MVALLSIAVFVVAALMALGSLSQSWQRYGKLALAARGELAKCPEHRELRYRIIELKPGNVVALPLRPRVVLESVPLRAAA
jgi:hypothetical protein